MILPSVAACLLSTPYWEVSFAAQYNYESTLPFGKVFSIVFDDYWKYVWPVVLTSALQIVASSLIMAAIDRHFRTAKMSLRSPFRLMNVSIVPVLLGVVIMSAVSVIFRFVLYGLVALIQWIADTAHFVHIATHIIVTAVAVGMFILHVLSIIPMLYWAPMMFVYGYGLRDAAAYSFKMIGGKKVGRGIMLPLVLCAGIQLLVGFTGAHEAVSMLVSFFIYLFTNMYVTVYVIVSFYHVSELDRRDVVVYMPIVTEPVKPADKPDKPKENVVNDERAEVGEETASSDADEKLNDEKPKKQKSQNKKKTDKPKSSGTGKKSASSDDDNKKKNNTNKAKKKPKSDTSQDTGNADTEVKEGEDVV